MILAEVFLAYVTPWIRHKTNLGRLFEIGHKMGIEYPFVSLQNVIPFGPAVQPAIANIKYIILWRKTIQLEAGYLNAASCTGFPATSS